MRPLLPLLIASLSVLSFPAPSGADESAAKPAAAAEAPAPKAKAKVSKKSASAPGSVVITVGPNKIRRSQIDQLVGQMAKANPSPEAMGEKEKAAMAQMIATNLIGQELLELESKALAITVDQKDVDSMYKALRSNFPDEAAWKRVLKEGGNTEQSFREKLTRQLKADKILNTKVPQVERPTYKEIIDYHAARKAQFPVNDSLRACQVLFIAAKGASADEVAKKKADLEKLRAELVKDSLDVEKSLTRFVLAARQFSQGPEAKDGGDLQRFHPDDFNPEFKKQVSRLRVGQLSPVFRTPLGWHLVMLTEKFDGKPDSYRLIISRAISQEKAVAAGKSLRKYLQGLAGKYKVNYLEQALRDTSPTGVYNL
jgi:peptidyl-prolyl cis-trans isomerase SurA